MTRWMTYGLAIALFVGIQAEAAARPSLFVPNEKGSAWWAGKLIHRAMSTSIGKVSTKDINSHLARRKIVTNSEAVCFIEAVEPNGVISADRAVQIDIDKTLREYPNSFRATYNSRSGRRFDVQVVVYELCGGDRRTGSALMITNEDGTLHTFDGQEFEFTRIFKRDDGKINVFGCFACGDVSELLYDSENDRFYYQWVGH